jgi:hypothetical protein
MEPPLHVVVDFNKFNLQHPSLQDIYLASLPKNHWPILFISRIYEYFHNIQGLNVKKKFKLIWEQILLNLAFCFSNYKDQGQTSELSYWASGGYWAILTGAWVRCPIHYVRYKPGGLVLKKIYCSKFTILFNFYLPLQVDVANMLGANLKAPT